MRTFRRYRLKNLLGRLHRDTGLGFKSDDGDGALTLSIVFVPLAVICLGLAINTSQVVSNKPLPPHARG